ncbi:MAG: glycosyltransferase [Bauldia sp.]|uniref:glycosyltransferase n=1 Tax=Bauldia sp. TaxID=2575872 RepID=UPI001DDD68CB|nr:glycosyltransferase [Bauldia sp.]MCB1496858.1 glycosyltransferase [Bauldia sp.]
MTGRITVGMPLFNGQDFVAEALRALQAQTFSDFEVIISVDGNDQVSAEACRPFLADRRFRMVVQTERLDWVGNFNWLLEQSAGAFFCYRQHDDTTAPDFFEKLLAVADRRPDAAIVYADCQFVGEQSHIEATPSIEGETHQRLRQFIERITPTACRGIIRKEAIAQAGAVRVDEFRSNQQIFVWLAKVLRWGSFLRLPEPIYYRRIHGDNYHKQNRRWSDEKKVGDWTTVFTGLLEAVLPTCTSVEERLFFQTFILDRVCVARSGQSYWIRPDTIEKSGLFILRCFERLAAEGNMDRWIALDPLVAPDTPPTTLADVIASEARRHRLAMEQAELERDRLLQENARLKARNKAKTEKNKALATENKALAAENRTLRDAKAVRFERAVRRLFGR